MEKTTSSDCGDPQKDAAVLEQLDQISKKLDGLNKCSISTVQMAKKVYAGLEDVKQVTGNFRAEIGKFHAAVATVTQDLKQVDYAITSMHRRIEETCSVLEIKGCQLLESMVGDSRQALGTQAKQFLATLENDGEDNPIRELRDAVANLRNMVVVLGLANLILLAALILR